MFVHRFDRYLLIEQLLTSFARGRTLRQLKDDGDVALGTVALLMNLSDTARPRLPPEEVAPGEVGRERRVKRSTFLHFLRQALQLERDVLDALLWLYEGKPLEPAEIKAYNLPPATHDGTDLGLRQVVLGQLQAFIRDQFPSSGRLRPQVTIFAADAEGRLQAHYAVEEIEKLPGHRLFVGGVPSYLVQPLEYIANERSSDPVLRQQMGSAVQDVRTGLRRYQVFREQIRLYGSRNIHSRSSIREYLETDEPEWNWTKLDAKVHVETLISVLRNVDEYPYYWVGLVDDTPSLEFQMKAMQSVVMRAARPAGAQRPAWGWHWILWEDRATVMKLYLDFETAWSGVLSEEEKSRGEIYPDRCRVAKELQQLVDEVS